MDKVIKILIERDGLSNEEAKAQIKAFLDEAYEVLDSGGSYDEIEDLLMDHLGLEPDYIQDLLF